MPNVNPKSGRALTILRPDPPALCSSVFQIRRYFAESPHADKITIRMGPALDTIKTLTGPLDLIFIDADKPNYANYYEACLPLLKPGGLIVADNVLWSGKVLHPTDDNDYAIVAFNRLVQSDPRVENVCLTVRDGMMLAWKRR
jgi:caffeoyl-CoA O-methyltransferase